MLLLLVLLLLLLLMMMMILLLLLLLLLMVFPFGPSESDVLSCSRRPPPTSCEILIRLLRPALNESLLLLLLVMAKQSRKVEASGRLLQLSRKAERGAVGCVHDLGAHAMHLFRCVLLNKGVHRVEVLSRHKTKTSNAGEFPQGSRAQGRRACVAVR